MRPWATLLGIALLSVVASAGASGHSSGLQAVAQAATSSFTSTGDGSWVWQNPLPQGNGLLDISCPSPSICFAVHYGGGVDGQLLATSDGGDTWIGQKSSVSDALYAINCP